jgi:fructose-1,6-bisphosphatase
VDGLIKNNPVAHTIEQAKAAAEADNQRFLDEAKAETAR